ncbi:hypothetical protein KDA_76430 [Dictyobacter alpinus]|uniref:HTH cro/C1-type domain-containing protein n=1 Tax=Dictyobacter alpinus TaxID=2014873 RepID=A0A402BLF0_9CHLR|nr:helix-turn-helix transcriptional regulator [Dictyobacter alpinus]GCE32159.1 hypothetical protein KDA_76430 [Dictyobacter alpinus]
MANTQHDTSKYTDFGRLLDALLTKKKMSYRQLAIRSGMSPNSQMSIIRACRGESTPERRHVLAWATILEATPDQRKALLATFHYDEDARLLEHHLEEANARIALLEHRVEELERENALLLQNQKDDSGGRSGASFPKEDGLA